MRPLTNAVWFAIGYYALLYFRGLVPIYVRHKFHYLQRLTRSALLVAMPYLIIWSLYRIPSSHFYWGWVLMWWTGIFSAFAFHTMTCMYARASQRKYIAPIACMAMLGFQIAISAMSYLK